MNILFLTEWTQLVSWIIVLAAIIWSIIRFFRMPTGDQVALIKECLLNWVVQAEADLGSGTGKVKLSDVYSQFCKAFPVIKMMVSFETFSGWVDETLDQMREMLAQNRDLRKAIGVEEGEKV